MKIKNINNLTADEIEKLITKISSINFGAGGNCGNLALALARELPNKDKKLIICSDWTEDIEDLENYIDWDSSVYHVAIMVDNVMFDFTGIINVNYLENFCKIEYDDVDPQIISWVYTKKDDDSFRKVFEWETTYDTYPEEYQELIKKELNSGD